MKYLVLGLFSLALLGFVCAQTTQDDSAQGRPITMMPYNDTSDPTQPFSNITTNNDDDNDNNNNNYNNNNNNMPTGSNPNSSQKPTAGPLPALKPTVTKSTGGKTTKSGQSRIFTSVSLLLGSFLLQALWQ
ncbi:ABC transporter H family member 4-like [Plectropomus leopardus]|uniref:ABC transporter H family member 4-like n=1 Tax=Plectropomus leopardus TaxID=160734 RepID=UPI001C4CA259|nr:ABC transporter H family member 4-like [Plectropomus leopardus]